MAPPRIETLLSARLFLSPRVVGERLYFISNMSGHMSLYVMDRKGGVPEPLLPPHIALQNPELMDGNLYFVFPKLGKILVMIDNNGDEFYEPKFIPIEGGFPESIFGEVLAKRRVSCGNCDPERNIAYFGADKRDEPLTETFRGDLENATLQKLDESKWGGYIAGVSEDHTQVALIDSYTFGDHVLYLRTDDAGERALMYGVPLQERKEGEQIEPNGLGTAHFTPGNRGLLLVSALFDDAYGLGYLDLSKPKEVQPVEISGIVHSGNGEMTALDHAEGNRYVVVYNIDGCSWAYEGSFDEASLTVTLDRVLCGQDELAGGTLEAIHYDEGSKSYALAFSTAVSPTQLYTIDTDGKRARHTNERVLGVPASWMSPGEDASFESHDGLRVSARLYLPAVELGYDGPRPLVYYVHGGPQGQERPNFAWFSMPLIQFLTLNGFAVFVPNVRGSTGYGITYMKHVDHDWGGLDRLDHVHAMTKVLPNDSRVDVSRAGVVGRSYGGYMTLTLSTRHPELWSAAVDMFGPTDLITFVNRVPETWKPYFHSAVGDPEKDRDFLLERSPMTYIDNLTAPMLAIQGKNDPRVTEGETSELVAHLRKIGKEIDYLMFEDEGHDVLKFGNKVRCYNAITDFFREKLGA